MNVISEKLLEAISIIANKTTDSLSFDKTIQANIVSEDDAENYIYSIKYQDNIMQAFGSTSYSIGDWVYVKIPEGDFSNKKIIERKVNTVANKIVEVAEKPDSASGNLFHIELNQGLVAGKDYDSIGSPSWGDIQTELRNKGKSDSAVNIKVEQAENQVGNFSVPLDTFPQNDFFTFAKSFSKLMVSCNFQTLFNNIPQTGEFGIKLEIEITNQEGNIATQNLVFNNYDMTGNYYNYTTPVNEYKVFDLGINHVKAELKSIKLKSIELYQEGFIYDTEYYYNADLEAGYNPIQNYKPNIIFSDLKLDFLGDGEGSYHLVTDPTGKNNIIKDDAIFSPPTADLYFGPSIVSEAKENIQWFEYNPKSIVGSVAGAGWQPWSPLEESAEGTTTTEWYTKELMAYCEYDGMTFHSEPIGYSKKTLGFSITYSLKNEGTLTVNNDAILDSKLVYFWYNNNKEVGETESINQVNRGETLTYTCYVYKEITIEEEVSLILLQTLTYTIDAAYLANRYASAINFKYSHSSAQYSIGSELIGPDTAQKNSWIDRTIEVISTDKDITFQKIEWLDRDGNVIIGTKETPLNYTGSMITKVWVEGDILHYNIRPTYSSYAASETKNYVQARVTYAADKEYETTKNAYVEFVRIGDNGTNGTVFHCDIDLEENKLKGSAFIGNETVTGEASFDWAGSQGINIDVNNNVTLALEENNYLAYARLEAAAAGYPSAYAFYPIYHDETDIANITTNLPKTILYNTNGYDPAYVSEDLWFKHNGSEIAIGTLEVFEGNGTIREITNEEISYWRFIPNEKRTSEYCILCLNNTYYLPILFLLNRYGNEAINGWDGSKLEIDENGQHIFTPTLGAGTKNDNNQFSGVVMGKDVQQNKTGIYGYKDGKNTFGLMEDGSAYFGSGTQLNSENRTITIGSLGTTTKTLIIPKETNPGLITNEWNSWEGSFGQYIGIELSPVKEVEKNTEKNILKDYIGQAITISFEIQAVTEPIGTNKNSQISIYPFQSDGISIADHFTFDVKSIEADNSWEKKIFTTTIKDWGEHTTKDNNGAEIELWGNAIGIFSIDTTETEGVNKKQYPFRIRNVKLILGLESNPEDGDYVNVNFQYGTGDPGDSNSTTSFKVSRDGLLSAKNAVIEGTVYAGAGEIGGMSLSNDKLFEVSATTSTNATGVFTWLSNGINTRFNYDSDNEIFLWAGAVNASKKSDGTWDTSQLGAYGEQKEEYMNDIKNSNWTSTGSNMLKKITDTASFYVTHEGKLHAKQGEIGGWNIQPWGLTRTVTVNGQPYTSGFQSPLNTHDENDVILCVGAKSADKWDSASFYVTCTGIVHATGAVIEGNITATSGQIGGWTIPEAYPNLFYRKNDNGYAIAFDTSKLGLSTSRCFKIGYFSDIAGYWGNIGGFEVYGDGTMRCSNAHITGGSLSVGSKFSVGSDGVLNADGADITGVLTAGVGSSLGPWVVRSDAYGSYIEGTSGGYKTILKVPSGTYIKDSYHNGVLTIYDPDKDAYPFILHGTGNLNCVNSYLDTIYIKNSVGTTDAMVLTGGKMYNKTPLTYNGGTYRYAVQFPYLKADKSDFAAKWAFIAGKDEGDGSSYGKVAGFKVDYDGTTYTKDGVIKSSDLNLKKEITPFNNYYDELFNNLKPCQFKYKTNTSNRIHAGFIAQEVLWATEASGLTSQDFAAIVHEKESDTWNLRYDEFVALNTWQIQKAKARISELETRVSQLESLLQANLD